MEVLQSLSGGLVAAAAVFIVAWLGKERYDPQFTAIREEIRQLRDDQRQTRSEIASLRSDLTAVALAVGATPKPQPG